MSFIASQVSYMHLKDIANFPNLLVYILMVTVVSYQKLITETSGHVYLYTVVINFESVHYMLSKFKLPIYWNFG